MNAAPEEPADAPPLRVFLQAVDLGDHGRVAWIQPERYLDASVLPRFKRACDGASYDASGRMFARLERVSAIVRRLREADIGVEVLGDLEAQVAQVEADAWAAEQMVAERMKRLSDQIHEETGDRLHPYQVEGSRWLAARRTGHLGDDPGLGKTLVAIASVAERAPVVVVCPASLKGWWSSQFVRYRSAFRVSRLQGRDAFRWPEAGEVVVVNYDVLPDPHEGSCTDGKKWVRGRLKCEGCASMLRRAADGTVVVFDEAHWMKDERSLRSRRGRALARAALKKEGKAFVLTATAMASRPPDLWSVYASIDIATEAFGDYPNFVRLLGGKEKRIRVGRGQDQRSVKKVQWDPDAVDPSVPSLISRVCLRRRREDVLPELPTKTFRELVVDVDEKSLRAIEKALLESGADVDELVEALKADRKIAFREISKVRSLLAEAKIPAMLEQVEIAENDKTPLVVCSVHRSPVDALSNRPGWAVVHGDVSPAARSEVVARFQTCSRCGEDVSRHAGKRACPDGGGEFASDLFGVAMTIQTGGVGFTLTRAWQMLQVDQSWTPGDNVQVYDRVCRIGQDRGVVITTLTARHKVDERTNAVLLDKMRMQARTVDLATRRPEL